MNEQSALQQTNIHRKAGVTMTSEMFIDEILSFFSWWYIEMPIWYIGLIQRVALICDDTLSISLLFKTFFVPWRRDYSWIGYFFGVVLRILYLPFAILITIVLIITLFALAVFWALLPLAATYFLLKTPFMI
jgi:hypothetical protein